MTDQRSEQIKLESGLARLGLDAPPGAVEQLLEFMTLLREWSGAYNLVSPGERAHLLARHVLDSLSIAPYLGNGPLLDIGTGAGLPGLPLAIIRPGMPAWLLDSAGKKIRFVAHVARTLALDNVYPVCARAGEVLHDKVFAAITARAFASLADFARAARPHCGAQTRLLAMKGGYPEQEIAALPNWLEVEAVHALDVPYLHAERHLVIMSLEGREKQ
ncbi:MAG: 16S rRNA (guanine(527)-N(7))-methyltransferase RsmG [Lysobacterales bacterium]|jgi:16S rRNA (guanine527-N7)-methyltransferase